MKTRFVILSLLLFFAANAVADSYSYAIALRGGANFPVGQNPYKMSIGGVGGLEFDYTRLWYRIHEKGYGIRIGFGVDYTYTQYGMTKYNDTYTNFDYKGNEMIYTIEAKPSQIQQNIQVMIPIMFAYRNGPLVLAAGFKIGVPVWNQGTAKVKDVNITAFYPKTGVPVVNELITGKFDPALEEVKTTNKLFPVNPMVAFDIGYEFHWGHKKLGLCMFMEASPVPFIHYEETPRMIDVQPIVNPSNPPAEVVYNPYSSRAGMPYISVGVRIHYAYRTHTPYNRIVTPE